MLPINKITREWWQTRRFEFDLYVSQLVIQEVSAGDQLAAAERLKVLEDIPVLRLSDEATELALNLVRTVALPTRASVDALHIAIAVVNGLDYLARLMPISRVYAAGASAD